jgi:hypothetical protein
MSVTISSYDEAVHELDHAFEEVKLCMEIMHTAIQFFQTFKNALLDVKHSHHQKAMKTFEALKKEIPDMLISVYVRYSNYNNVTVSYRKQIQKIIKLIEKHHEALAVTNRKKELNQTFEQGSAVVLDEEFNELYESKYGKSAHGIIFKRLMYEDSTVYRYSKAQLEKLHTENRIEQLDQPTKKIRVHFKNPKYIPISRKVDGVELVPQYYLQKRHCWKHSYGNHNSHFSGPIKPKLLQLEPGSVAVVVDATSSNTYVKVAFSDPPIYGWVLRRGLKVAH